MDIVKKKLMLVTIAVADPGEGARANSDNAKFFMAKYCGIQNNVKNDTITYENTTKLLYSPKFS